MALRNRSSTASERRAEDRRLVAEFEAMVRQVHPFLVAYARRRLVDSAVADDVVAETLAIAWRRWSDFPRDGQELAYLYGVERRVLANQKRAIRRQQSLVARLEHHQSPTSEMDQLTDRDVLIATAFGKLRKTDQELLALSFWEGFSNREIGIALGCSENAATIRLHRARKRLGDLVGSGASPNNDDSDKEAS